MAAAAIGDLPADGGPVVDGDVVTLDVGLVRSAAVALELLAHDAGRHSSLVRSDLIRLQDALADAHAEACREAAPDPLRGTNAPR